MMLEARIYRNKIQVVTDKPTAKKLRKEFSVLEPGAEHKLSVQMGRSDGRKKFYRHRRLDSENILMEFELGFIDRLNDFFGSTLVGKIETIPRTEILEFLKEELPLLPFKARKYQLRMVIGILQHERHLGILATGGGKSLVAYLVIKFLLKHKQKTILIVPTINLVDQMFNDFKSYNASDEFLEKFQLIGGEYKDKNLKKPIIISTWQSLNNVPRAEISKFDCLYVDEAHKAKAEVLTDILKQNVQKKIGQTGSMPIIESDFMQIEEVFGKPVMYANAKDLIELGLLTKTTIIALFLNYPRSMTVSGLKYQQETKLIRENQYRMIYLSNFLKKISNKGITVTTFNTIKFGESLYGLTAGRTINRIRNNFEKQKETGVFFIDGKTKSSVREQIRQYLNSQESKGEIIIAQTTTFDTGINVPKLKNFVFGEAPGKSFTRILQSIGRVMRNSEASGNHVYVWDLVDCFDYATENYTLQHFWERLKYYESEGHPVIEKEVNLSTP